MNYAALKVVRQCIQAGRFNLTAHFSRRMDQRGLVWVDILAVIDGPGDVCDDGLDRFGREKWIVAGPAADGLRIEIVCAVDVDDKGNKTVFITLYF